MPSTPPAKPSNPLEFKFRYMNKENPFKSLAGKSRSIVKDLVQKGVELDINKPMKNFTWNDRLVYVYVYFVRERIVIFRHHGKVNVNFEKAITEFCRGYGLSARVIHNGASIEEAFDPGELQQIIETAKTPRQLRLIGERDVKHVSK